MNETNDLESKFWSMDWGNNPWKLPVIKTARDIRSINAAVTEGFRPLLRKVEPNPRIRWKCALMQHKETGEVVWIGDYRSEDRLSERQGYELALDWFYYDPYPVSVPFAAYLIPKDLAPGTRVWVEDLIENLVGECWNQGDVYRLEKAEAVWTGEYLVIDHDPKKPPQMLIG